MNTDPIKILILNTGRKCSPTDASQEAVVHHVVEGEEGRVPLDGVHQQGLVPIHKIGFNTARTSVADPDP